MEKKGGAGSLGDRKDHYNFVERTRAIWDFTPFQSRMASTGRYLVSKALEWVGGTLAAAFAPCPPPPQRTLAVSLHCWDQEG